MDSSAKIITEYINKQRIQNINRVLNRTQILEILSEVPYRTNFIGKMISYHMIQRNGIKYQFTGVPVHVEKIQKILDEMRSYYRSYNNKRSNIIPNQNKEQACIEYLKSKGYIIQKPVTTYETV